MEKFWYIIKNCDCISLAAPGKMIESERGRYAVPEVYWKKFDKEEVLSSQLNQTEKDAYLFQAMIKDVYGE